MARSKSKPMSADEFYRDLPESVVPLLDAVPLGQESWVAECEAIENDETLSLTERFEAAMRSLCFGLRLPRPRLPA